VHEAAPELSGQIQEAKKGIPDETKAALDGHFSTVKKTLGLS
jgi:hypothetical protein